MGVRQVDWLAKYATCVWYWDLMILWLEAQLRQQKNTHWLALVAVRKYFLATGWNLNTVYGAGRVYEAFRPWDAVGELQNTLGICRWIYWRPGTEANAVNKPSFKWIDDTNMSGPAAARHLRKKIPQSDTERKPAAAAMQTVNAGRRESVQWPNKMNAEYNQINSEANNETYKRIAATNSPTSERMIKNNELKVTENMRWMTTMHNVNNRVTPPVLPLLLLIHRSYADGESIQWAVNFIIMTSSYYFSAPIPAIVSILVFALPSNTFTATTT